MGSGFSRRKIDDTLSLFDASSGQALSEVKKLEDLDYFSGLAFSLDDRFLVATTNSGRSALLEVDEQGQLRYAEPCIAMLEEPMLWSAALAILLLPVVGKMHDCLADLSCPKSDETLAASQKRAANDLAAGRRDHCHGDQ